VDANGNVAVRVALPAAPAKNARSVADDNVGEYANWYEVIFRVHNETEYSFASAEAGKEYLSVSVIPGQRYDILLLAGTKSNRVLLATGFVNNADGITGSISGPGYLIEAGKAHVIKPLMHKTNISPDDPDDEGPLVANIVITATKTASADLSVTYLRDVTTDFIATATVTKDTDPLTLVATLATTKFIDLINAAGTGGALNFASNKGQLAPRYGGTDTANFGAIQTKLGVDTGTGTGPYTYTFNIAKPGKLDIDGKLRLNLGYYAFGNPNSQSSLWNIRNGLDYDLDDNGTGGSIVVKFGDGSKVTETSTIDFDI
jgi:hypothetical protein